MRTLIRALHINKFQLEDSFEALYRYDIKKLFEVDIEKKRCTLSPLNGTMPHTWAVSQNRVSC